MQWFSPSYLLSTHHEVFKIPFRYHRLNLALSPDLIESPTQCLSQCGSLVAATRSVGEGQQIRMRHSCGQKKTHFEFNSTVIDLRWFKGFVSGINFSVLQLKPSDPPPRTTSSGCSGEEQIENMCQIGLQCIKLLSPSVHRKSESSPSSSSAFYSRDKMNPIIPPQLSLIYSINRQWILVMWCC